MMGPGHALSGAAAWMVVAPALSTMSPTPFTAIEIMVGAGVCAGAALLPDIDEPQSTVARSFGPLTWLIAQVVSVAAAGWYNLTKTRREPFESGGHRKLTHSLIGMVVCAAAVGLLAHTMGRWAVAAILFVLLGLAIRGLMGDWAKKTGWIGVTVVSAAAAVIVGQALGDGSYWWLAVTVLVGVVVHGLGDGITKEGVPWLAPLPVRGKAWYEFTLPGFLRIRAGGWVETAVVYPVLGLMFLAGSASAFMGGWSALWATVGIGS